MNNQLNQKTNGNKFSGKRLILLIILIVVPAAIVCGLIYWQLNQIVQTKNDQIDSLTKKINTTSEKIKDLSSKE